MGKKPKTMRSKWTPELDMILCAQVAGMWGDVVPRLKGSGYTLDQYFWFVAGALFDETNHVASGPACQTRWHERKDWYHEHMRKDFERREAEAEAEAEKEALRGELEKWDEAWQEMGGVAEIEAWAVEDMQRTTTLLLTRVDRLCAELGIEFDEEPRT